MLSKPFGLRGQVKLDVDSQISSLGLLEKKKIYVKNNKNYDFFIVEKDELISKKRILKFTDLNSIEAIEAYIGKELYVVKKDVAITLMISYLNWQVQFNDKYFGKVIDTIFNGSHDLIKVEKENKEYIWIPMIKNFILKTLKTKKTIFVKNIEDF